MRWSPPDPATQALAQSLLYEALEGAVSAPTEKPKRGSGWTGRPLVWTKDTVVAALQDFFTQYGRAPTAGEWQRPSAYGIPGYASVKVEFGSVAAGLRAAGIDPPPRRRAHRKRNDIPKETL